jgi:hypothetical protein
MGGKVGAVSMTQHDHSATACHNVSPPHRLRKNERLLRHLLRHIPIYQRSRPVTVFSGGIARNNRPDVHVKTVSGLGRRY